MVLSTVHSGSAVKNVLHKQLEAESPDELLRQPVQHLSEPSEEDRGQVDSYHHDNNNTEHWLDEVQELSVWVLVPVSWSPEADWNRWRYVTGGEGPQN